MTHPSTPFTTGLRLLVAVLLIVPAVALSTAAPAKAAPEVKVTGPKTPRQALPEVASSTKSSTKQPKIAPMAMTSSEYQAINLVNVYRARYGARAIPTNQLNSMFAKSHANYCQLNGDVAPGCTRPYSFAEWENPSKRGFTSRGSDYASYMLMVPTNSPTRAIDIIMHDPGFRDGWLLDLGARSIGVGTVGGWTMVLVDWFGTPSGYPRSFPVGSNVPSSLLGLDLQNTAQAQWTKRCPSSSRYGYPISSQWDYTRYGMQVRAYGNLYRDGVKQWTCMVSNASMLLNGQSVMIPMQPLTPGSIYTGNISSTFPYGGGTQVVNKPIAFTTYAPATGAPGDQSGDRVADFTAIGGSNLYFRKMNKSGTVGPSLLISTRFNTSTWLGRAPDVNGDRRDDLMSRNIYGDIYIWYGNGMGSYTQGPKVGIQWNDMNLIVPVGDMNGDGTPEMIARHKNGELWRYTIFKNKITFKTKIGQGWGGMEWMVGIGKYTRGDNRYDIVSIDKRGDLWLWPTNTRGAFDRKIKIGRGWGGYTFLFSPGDINGDGRPDLIARDRSGTLWTWFNNWSGLARVKAGPGWGGYRAFG